MQWFCFGKSLFDIVDINTGSIMSLHIFNSLTRKKEEFVPRQDGFVTMYVCGPTVYDDAHIGHAKSYVSFDVMVRYLRYLGYRVRYVQNITDVGHLLDSGEDRIMKGASREKLEPMELVEKYTRSYFQAMDALNVVRPNISPRASGHIPEQIDLVTRLLEAGYAYHVDGSVYFDISKWQDYGKLTNRKIDEQKEGARLEVNEEKKHPADFALWKKADPSHLMQWNSPWGKGYPGWHIECSAMAMKYLGESIDIHGGGIENQFPHHECEIAQSEAATHKPFVRYWIHNNMVLIDGVKMSKSLGNHVTVEQALEKFDGNEIRFFILQSHYRSPVDFSDKAIMASSVGLERLNTTYRQLDKALSQSTGDRLDSDNGEMIQRHTRAFEAAMNDDFNTPAAIAALFDFSRDINRVLSEARQPSLALLRNIRTVYQRLASDVLGIELRSEEQEGAAGPFVDLLLSLRQRFRKQKEYDMSDYIRDELQKRGVILEDTPESTRWHFD
jgi:cysteinyl-tRNA synthetase